MTRRQQHALVFALGLFASACNQTTQPTSTQSNGVRTSALAASALSSIAVSGPSSGCQPATQAVEWLVTVTSAPELIRLYPSAFRDPKAGCDPTTSAQALMTVEGPSHYAIGASGQTRFVFEAGRAQCGRVAVGVIYKDANEFDTMLAWRIVNTGVDCPTPPPDDPPPPPGPTPPPNPPPPGPTPPVPPPDPCAGPWTYSGANPFDLPNSGDATQLSYVRAHVSPLLEGPIKTSLNTTEWRSDGNYPVVVVKSSTNFALHVNVTTGQVLPTSSTNKHGVPQDISHVSRFICEAKK